MENGRLRKPADPAVQPGRPSQSQRISNQAIPLGNIPPLGSPIVAATPALTAFPKGQVTDPTAPPPLAPVLGAAWVARPLHDP